jgi:hypothetical protein
MSDRAGTGLRRAISATEVDVSAAEAFETEKIGA